MNNNKYYWRQLLAILKNTRAWINGFFVGLSFTVITVFAAMWGVPFIQVKLACTLQQASFVDAMVFFGAAISCPLFGYLANWFPRRRPLMLNSCLATATLLLIVLYLPIHNSMLLALLMFLIGLCCGAYMLAFTIANELAPANLLSTCSGFTNTLAMLTAPLLQLLIGYLLDISHDPLEGYSLRDYQNALLTIPMALVIASILVFFLPEKK